MALQLPKLWAYLKIEKDRITHVLYYKLISSVKEHNSNSYTTFKKKNLTNNSGSLQIMIKIIRNDCLSSIDKIYNS